jgi:antitoxin Phd
MKWTIEQAKARFAELLERALKEAPQTLIRRGKPVAVLVSADEHRRPCSGGKSFKAFLAAAPLRGVRIYRGRDAGRPVHL